MVLLKSYGRGPKRFVLPRKLLVVPVTVLGGRPIAEPVLLPLIPVPRLPPAAGFSGVPGPVRVVPIPVVLAPGVTVPMPGIGVPGTAPGVLPRLGAGGTVPPETGGVPVAGATVLPAGLSGVVPVIVGLPEVPPPLGDPGAGPLTAPGTAAVPTVPAGVAARGVLTVLSELVSESAAAVEA